MMTGPGVEAPSGAAGDDDRLSGGVVSLIDGHVVARGAVEGKHESEEGPPARPVLRFHGAAVRLDDRPADGQTETNAMNAGRPTAIELVEDSFLIGFTEARPPIGELHQDRGRCGRGRD